MAITIARQILSGSTDGLTITVTATSPSLTAILHTGSSLTSVTDEVFIYCWAGMPLSTGAGSGTVLEPGRKAAFFIGSTADESYQLDLQAGGKPRTAIGGLLIRGNATPVTITAHRPNGESSFPFYVAGWVNRITET